MTDIKVEINEDGTFKPTSDPELNKELEALDRYITSFKMIERKMEEMPWILKTLAYFPVGMIVEMYWIGQMEKLNKEFERKYLAHESVHND